MHCACMCPIFVFMTPAAKSGGGDLFLVFRLFHYLDVLNLRSLRHPCRQTAHEDRQCLSYELKET